MSDTFGAHSILDTTPERTPAPAAEQAQEPEKAPRRGRGFSSMTDAKRSEIASKGGIAAHKVGTAHEWTREEAAAAGRKGGTVSRRGKKQRT